MVKKNKEKKINKTDYSYPEPDDENIIDKIYRKREFQFHRIPKRKKNGYI